MNAFEAVCLLILTVLVIHALFSILSMDRSLKRIADALERQALRQACDAAAEQWRAGGPANR